MNMVRAAACLLVLAAVTSAQTVNLSPVRLDGTPPAIGRSFTATVSLPGGPGAPYLLAFDALAAPVPVKLPGVGELGLALTPSFLILQSAVLDGQGQATFGLGLPNDPALVGFSFYLQALVYTNASPAGAYLSNLYRGDITRPGSHTPVPGTLQTQRLLHTATTLKDGRVLVAGGGNGTLAAPLAVTTTELYHPWTKQFDFTRDRQGFIVNLNVDRVMHTATLLDDGRVLIAGGFDAQGNALSSAELLDPATGRFTLVAGGMSRPRGSHTATRLPDGRVLLAGGTTAAFTYPQVFGGATDTTEIFDPATNRFTAGPAMLTKRMQHAAVALRVGGRDYVLVMSGIKGLVFFVLPDYTDKAEVYDVTVQKFSGQLGGRTIGPMQVKRVLFGAAREANGRVLVVGGATGAIPGATASAEEFDPASGSWGALPAIPTARAMPTATLLNDGRVLVQGGAVGSLNAPLGIASAYLFTGTAWVPTASLTAARGGHTAVRLKGGAVVAIGGGDGTNGTALTTAEFYTP